MTDAGRKIIVRSEDIARNDGCEEIAVLLEVRSICDVNQSLGIAVAEVGRMRRSVVDLKEAEISVSVLQ